MQRTLCSIGALLVTFAASASASDTDALIALDKQWGESIVKGDMTVSAKLLTDEFVSVSENGVRGKKEELADDAPAPAGTRYEPTDYKVMFLNSDTAIMTHSTKGDDAHTSLHVWSRKEGNWQLIASSTTPLAKK